MPHRLTGLRFLAGISFAISLALAVITVGPSPVAYQTAGPNPDCSAAKTRTNLVFIIDRSGSLADKIDFPHEGHPGRGQTYNVEIDGMQRALRDPLVIPRDGSVSVGAVLFDGGASVALPITAPVSSDKQAMDIAASIETLRCPGPEITSCPAGDTNFGTAIMQADQIASSFGGARRVFIMSTDGMATDGDKGVEASNAARQHASMAGVEAELDVILIGAPAEEVAEVQELVNKLVFPSPPGDLPGAVEVIPQTTCNMPGASFDATCECQSQRFADFTRRALRSNVDARNLTVTTALDPDPNTLLQAGGPLSLRQAIELANSNGGHTVITFDLGPGVKRIEPNVPLPPLTAPDITICGCAADCSSSIPDKLTCQQPLQRDESGCAPAVIIDGRGKLQDGILIRSNRDVVRGLIIKNFTHAGIVIQPVCPSDNTGFNRVELNELDDNIKAGICVLDPPPGQLNAVVHNTGNTISMNNISGSETPIDLGSAQPFKESAPMSVCDGPTANDAGDADQGPNTLLNFPDDLIAETADGTVSITGKANGPGAPGSTVEIFAVQKFNPSNGKTSVTAVTFFKSVTAADDGSFAAAGPSASPILGYTATVTDSEGNTSELRTFCSGPALAALNRDSIRFDVIDPTGASPDHPQAEEFVVTNLGCSELNTTVSVVRAGAAVERIDPKFRDDSGFFPAESVDAPFSSKVSGASSEQAIPVIPPGLRQRFQVEFTPVIPRVVTKKMEEPGGVRANDVLSKKLKSAIILGNKSDNLRQSITLIGQVTRKLKLIDPVTTSNPPKVTLQRSADNRNLSVAFSVFDSNLNVSSVNYKFFKIRDGNCSTSEPVPAEIVDPDLTKAIRERDLVTGQSFSVIQSFSRANEHPEALCVMVTVFDAETSVSATALEGGGSSAGGSLETQKLRQSQRAVIVRPTLKLARSFIGSRAAIVHRAASARNKTAGAHSVRASSGERGIR